MASVVTAQVLRDAFLRARRQDILEHYVPGSLTRELIRTGAVAHAGREEELSVLLADIRGFTTLTASLSPAEAVAFLNAYLVRAIPPLVAEGAVIDKYIGDGILAFFEGEGHKRRAVRAARALLGAVEDFNRSRASQDALGVGVALHTGRAMVGTIGTEERREYTVISDTVNVTARLEELNKRYDSCIVASEPVLAACEDGLRWGFAGPSSVEIRGRDTALSVYYLPRTP
jgi:adenylate cyclase